MDFSKTNCNFAYRFYNYTLNKYYGMGKADLTYKDRLYMFLNIHWQFLPSDTVGTTGINTEFVGTITNTSIVLPTVVSTLFYENDQAAYDGGIEINSIYYLSKDNTYGMPFGTPKKLVEDVE